MELEVWKIKDGYSNYQISNFGNIRSISRSYYNKIGRLINIKGRNLKFSIDKDGYYHTNITDDFGVKKKFRVQRLVAELFVENENNFTIVNHLDSNRKNNHYQNLVWTNQAGNMQHAMKSGRMKISVEKFNRYLMGNKHKNNDERSISVVQKDNEGNIIKVYKSKSAASRAVGVSTTSITYACDGTNLTSGGYIWEYLDGTLNDRFIKIKEEREINKQDRLAKLLKLSITREELKNSLIDKKHRDAELLRVQREEDNLRKKIHKINRAEELLIIRTEKENYKENLRRINRGIYFGKYINPSPVSMVDLNGVVINNFESLSSAKKYCKLSTNTIIDMCDGINKGSDNFTFRWNFNTDDIFEQIDGEVWLPIPIFENYEVSNLGRIKNTLTKCLLSTSIDRYGYETVIIKKKMKRVHQVVAMSFLNHTLDGTNTKIVSHIDGNKLNNNVNNLKISTLRKAAIERFKNNENIGVRKNRKKWVAQIRHNGISYNLGSYQDIDSAKSIYLKALSSIEEDRFDEFIKNLKIEIRKNFTSKYKGIYFNGKKWVLNYRINGVQVNIGRFESELDAYNKSIEVEENVKKGLCNMYTKKEKGVKTKIKPCGKKFRLDITYNKRSYYIGLFETNDEANKYLNIGLDSIKNNEFTCFLENVKKRKLISS